MSKEIETVKDIAFSPGHIIYNGRTTVSRPGFESSLEVVHFVLNTVPGENGLMEGLMLDENWELLTDKVTRFASVDEFFAFNSYLVRNGIAVNPPKKQE